MLVQYVLRGTRVISLDYSSVYDTILLTTLSWEGNMGNMENKFVALLKSRKFWAATLGVGSVVLIQLNVVDQAAADKLTEAIMVILGLFILGTGLEDGLARRA